ncbi:MAG: UDP-N-acetylmuramate--L-alanine ligase [Oligoflexia bacterium]|nr:UDP-N-acetylmuramate--L-alanine ligase [Oligoflexia bacterium]
MNLSSAKIHFVGIGGIGMSGIAEVLVNTGCTVSGSDLNTNIQVERLKAMGVQIHIGHHKDNLPQDCHAVVYSSAVSKNNPELLKAKENKIPIIRRAEMLAEIMRLKRGIAIGGTHGKTTTTSMVATMMIDAGLDPTIVIGGRLDLIKSNAALGKGQWFVAEADESDGSFLHLNPEILVLTNIDNDHLEHFGSFEKLLACYKDFSEKIPFYGSAILCTDDMYVNKLSKNYPKRFLSYGFNKQAQLRAENIKSSMGIQKFSVTLEGKKLGDVELLVPGRHNILNALAAIAIGIELQIDFQKISQGLNKYTGVDRRLQKIGSVNEVDVYDDYGHHPTEVSVTISALRELYPKNRIVIAFQPHRYTRTKECWNEFLGCFKGADAVAIFDIYEASEKKIKGITSEKLALAIKKKNKSAFYAGSLAKGAEKVFNILRPNDVLLTLGAGDIYKIGKEYLNKN